MKKKSFFNNTQVAALTRPIRKHHALLFILAALFIMIFSVYNVNQILSQPEDAQYRTEAETKSVRTNFDQATIDKINQLKERQEGSALNLPSGRINPFRE
ncbi:MAG TPA: hypothetical protein VFZ48_01400 [Candidatus Saccharimonadales bacterium]